MPVSTSCQKLTDTSSISLTSETQTVLSVSAIGVNPKLALPDQELIRRFLSSCNQYVHEVIAKAKQQNTGILDLEEHCLTDVKICMDIEYLKSTFALGLIFSVDAYDELTDECFREYIDNRAAKS